MSNIFSKGHSFDRNLEYVVPLVPYNYLKNIVPYNLISTWNKLSRGHKDWVKENFTNKNKSVFSNPKTIPENCNDSLNRFRLNGFKKSLIDDFLQNYKTRVKCNNQYCNDCN